MSKQMHSQVVCIVKLIMPPLLYYNYTKNIFQTIIL